MDGSNLRTVSSSNPPDDPSMLRDVARLFRTRSEQSNREHINWIKLFRDIHQPECVYAVMGYDSGLQVWLVGQSDAKEIFSSRSAAFGAATLMFKHQDQKMHPILIAAANMPSARSNNLVSMFSLINRQPMLPRLELGDYITEISANSKHIIICTNSCIYICNSSLEVRHQLSDAWVSQQQTYVSLGDRWLAYACTTQSNIDLMANGDHHSVMQTVVGVAQKTGSKLWDLGGKSVQKMSQYWNGNTQKQTRYRDVKPEHSQTEFENGSVCIFDLDNLDTVFRVRAHTGPIQMLSFDSSGTLLAVADDEGQSINIIKLAKSPPCLLYTLQRGVTTATIQSLDFSLDSRMLVAMSSRGTAHVFAIHPSGGPVSAATHTKATVPNMDRFMQTSGISELIHRRTTVLESIMKFYFHLASEPEPQTNPAPSRRRASSNAVKFGRIVEAMFANIWVQDDQSLYQMFFMSNDGSLHRRVLTLNGTQTRTSIVSQHQEPPGLLGFVTKLKSNTEDSPIYGITIAEKSRQYWQLTRCLDWVVLKPSARQDQMALEQSSFKNEQTRASSSTDESAEWLSEVEIDTYPSPHRRLWMGPQFQFNRLKKTPQTSSDEGLFYFDAGLRKSRLHIKHPDIRHENSSIHEEKVTFCLSTDSALVGDTIRSEMTHALSEHLGEELDHTLSGQGSANESMTDVHGIFAMDYIDDELESQAEPAFQRKFISDFALGSLSDRSRSSSSSRSASQSQQSAEEFTGPSSAPTTEIRGPDFTSLRGRPRGKSLDGRCQNHVAVLEHISTQNEKSRFVSRGLEVALGVEGDSNFHRVESNISVDGLAEAFSSEGE